MEVITVDKKYPTSAKEVEALKEEGYEILSMAYWMNTDGPTSYIMGRPNDEDPDTSKENE